MGLSVSVEKLFRTHSIQLFKLPMSLATQFSKNLSFIVWARGISVAVNLTFLGISARAYGVVEFGQLIFVLATTSFMELIFCGSADSILVREQVRNFNDREENLRACALLHGIFSLVVILASFSIAWYFRRDWNVSRGLMFAGIASACQILFSIPVAHFRSEQNMFFEAVLITGERLLFLSGLLIVVATKAPMVSVFACLMISMATKMTIGYAWLFRRVAVRVVTPAAGRLSYFWVESLPLMGISLILSLHWRVDLFLMKVLSSAEQLGVYAASFRAMEMLRIVPVDVITSAFPIFCAAAASQAGNNQLARAYSGLVRLALCSAVLVTVVSFWLAPTATRLLFGGGFANAVAPLRILILSFPLIFWNQIDSITLTATGRQRWMLFSLMGALACQLLVDLILIPRRGAAGAGFGFALGEAALLAGTLAAVVPLAIDITQFLRMFAKLIVSALALWFLIGWFHGSSLVIAGVFLLPAYLLLLVLLNVVTRAEIAWAKASLGRLVRSGMQPGQRANLQAPMVAAVPDVSSKS